MQRVWRVQPMLLVPFIGLLVFSALDIGEALLGSRPEWGSLIFNGLLSVMWVRFILSRVVASSSGLEVVDPIPMWSRRVAWQEVVRFEMVGKQLVVLLDDGKTLRLWAVAMSKFGKDTSSLDELNGLLRTATGR